MQAGYDFSDRHARAAASSIASGMPSSRRQISATAAELSSVTLKSAPDLASPVGEQLDGATVERQRRHTPGQFTGASRIGSRLVANSVNEGQAEQEGADQIGACIQQVLAIVHHYEQLRVAHEAHQVVGGGTAGLIWQTKRASGRHRNEVGMGERREVDVVHAVAEVACGGACDFKRQARLSRAAGAGQRDESVLRQDRLNFRHLRVAANEAGELGRKIPFCNALRCSKRRKFVRNVRMTQLHNRWGLGRSRRGCVPRSISQASCGSRSTTRSAWFPITPSGRRAPDREAVPSG